MKQFALAILAAFVPASAIATPDGDFASSLSGIQGTVAKESTALKNKRDEFRMPFERRSGAREITHFAVRRAENVTVIEYDDLCYKRRFPVLPSAKEISCVAVSFDAFYEENGQERKLDKRLIAFVSPKDGSHPDRVLNDAIHVKEILKSFGTANVPAFSVDILIKKDAVENWRLTDNQDDKTEVYVAEEMIVSGRVNGPSEQGTGAWSDARVFQAPVWIPHLRKLR